MEEVYIHITLSQCTTAVQGTQATNMQVQSTEASGELLNWPGYTCHCNLSPPLCTTQMKRYATFIWQCKHSTRTGNSYGRLFTKWTKWITALVQSVTKGLTAHSTVKYFWSLHGNWPTCERMFRMLLWRKPPQRVELQHQSQLHPTYRGHWDKPPQTLK